MAVPVSLNSAVVSKFSKVDTITRQPIADSEIDSLVAAVGTLQEAATSIDGLKATIGADRTQSVEANALRLRNGASALASRAAARLDEAAAKAANEIARIDAATRSPSGPRDAAEIALHGELRAVLRGMADGKRAEAVAGNDALVAAVLSVDAILSGLSPTQHAALRHSWRRKHFPAETERLARLEKAVEAATRSGTIFVDFVRQATDSEAARIAETNAIRAAEAIAASHQAN